MIAVLLRLWAAVAVVTEAFNGFFWTLGQLTLPSCCRRRLGGALRAAGRSRLCTAWAAFTQRIHLWMRYYDMPPLEPCEPADEGWPAEPAAPPPPAVPARRRKGAGSGASSSAKQLAARGKAGGGVSGADEVDAASAETGSSTSVDEAPSSSPAASRVAELLGPHAAWRREAGAALGLDSATAAAVPLGMALHALFAGHHIETATRVMAAVGLPPPPPLPEGWLVALPNGVLAPLGSDGQLSKEGGGGGVGAGEGEARREAAVGGGGALGGAPPAPAPPAAGAQPPPALLGPAAAGKRGGGRAKQGKGR